MFMTDHPTRPFDHFTLHAHTHAAGCHPSLRSMPKILRRDMHRAEPVEMIKQLTWRWWAQRLIDSSQAIYRIMTQPIGKTDA